MTSKPKKNNFKARERARRFAMQAIYQWQLADSSFPEIKKQFLSQEEMVSVDTDYFEKLVHGVMEHHASLDENLEPLLDRALKELGPVELAILRLAAYELCNLPELPYKVVLNEAIELAKVFGATDSHKYVNGVLHKLAEGMRPLEFN